MSRNFTKSADIENLEWTNSVRFGSSSSQASQSSSGVICRICHCESDPLNPLFSPCYCSGTLKFVHQSCLQQWLTASGTSSCELCKFPFVMHTKIKPFNEWRSLDMSGVERRRLLCAILFHAAAAICVVWSLCVLIERAAEEVNRGQIGWPFWTKLVVVTVGLTGGCVFMYIQCKQYLTLCNRWRAKNRILLIQNCPEKFHPPQSPQSHHVGRMQRNHSSTMGVGGVGVVSGFSNNSSCAQTLSSRQHTIDLADATMISENIGELDPDQSSSSVLTYQHPLSAANHRHYQHHLGQIVANIENSSINYDRDWTLDDISQASLFKPNTGSQADSLTPLPYHEQLTDSQSNIYNNATAMNSGAHHHSSNIYNNPNINLQNCSVSTSSYEKIKSSSSSSNQKTPNLANDLNVFKVKSKHPNSAVFVENRDILNDAAAINSNYNPKIYHRHSTAVDYFPMSATPSIDFYENLDERIDQQHVHQEPGNVEPKLKDTRRYSDTKLLLQQQHEKHLQQYSNLNLCAGTTPNYVHNKPNKYYNNTRTNKNQIINLTNVWGPETSINLEDPAMQQQQQQQQQTQITDIIFENSQGSDPLELNIQELLELDIEYQNSSNSRNVRKLRCSADDVLAATEERTSDQIGDIRTESGVSKRNLMYKSLPNLITGSSENLLP